MVGEKGTIYTNVELLSDNVEELSFQSIDAYPNPSSGKATVEGIKGRVQTIIANDLSGKSFEIGSLQVGSKVELDLTHLPAGYYLVRIITDDSVYRSNLIIER